MKAAGCLHWTVAVVVVVVVRAGGPSRLSALDCHRRRRRFAALGQVSTRQACPHLTDLFTTLVVGVESARLRCVCVASALRLDLALRDYLKD